MKLKYNVKVSKRAKFERGNNDKTSKEFHLNRERKQIYDRKDIGSWKKFKEAVKLRLQYEG